MKGVSKIMLKIEIEFTEPLLGTLSGNKEAATEFVLAKHPNGHSADEAEALVDGCEKLEKQTTFFPADASGPFLWDYQIKGFLKEAMECIAETGQFSAEELKAAKLSAFGPTCRKRFDRMVFVSPRKIYLRLPPDAALGMLERPLRAMTMKGERVSLARSQTAPAGTQIVCTIETLNPKLDPFISECLDYGALRGVGQWRNSGAGRFVWRDAT